MVDITLNVPTEMPIEKDLTKRPFVIVADEAFPFYENLLRPYGGLNLSVEKKCLVIGYQGLEGILNVHLVYWLINGSIFLN
nr:unnamed protein product [Callosobruchus analis]